MHPRWQRPREDSKVVETYRQEGNGPMDLWRGRNQPQEFVLEVCLIDRTFGHEDSRVYAGLHKLQRISSSDRIAYSCSISGEKV